MNVKSAVLAALVALPVVPLTATPASAQELRTSITQQMGAEPEVRGSFQLDPGSEGWALLRDAASPRDGSLSLGIRAEGSDDPLVFRTLPEATLERPELGRYTVIERHSGRVSAEQLEALGDATSVLVQLRDLAGQAITEPISIPVVVSDRDEERVRTPFAAATVGRAAGARVVGDLALVRTNNGGGRVVARVANSEPFTIEADIVVTFAESAARVADNGGPTEEVSLTFGSIRVRYSAPAPSLFGVVVAINNTKGEAPATLDAILPGGGSAPVANGTASVNVRDMTLRLRSIEPGARNAARALRFTQFTDIPAALEVSVSTQDTDEGFVSTVGSFDAERFGRTAITEFDADIAQLSQELGALFIEVTYDGRPDPNVPMTDDVLAPDKDGCALEVVEGARCTSPRGGELRLTRIDNDRLVVLWDTPGGLSTLPFAVSSFSVQSVDGRITLGEQRPDRAFFTASPVFDAPLSFDRTSETEQRYIVEVFGAGGESLGASAGTFLPIAGLTPLIPDPLGPIRFDPGCAWWDLLCRWDF